MTITLLDVGKFQIIFLPKLIPKTKSRCATRLGSLLSRGYSKDLKMISLRLEKTSYWSHVIFTNFSLPHSLRVCNLSSSNVDDSVCKFASGKSFSLPQTRQYRSGSKDVVSPIYSTKHKCTPKNENTSLTNAQEPILIKERGVSEKKLDAEMRKIAYKIKTEQRNKIASATVADGTNDMNIKKAIHIPSPLPRSRAGRPTVKVDNIIFESKSLRELKSQILKAKNVTLARQRMNESGRRSPSLYTDSNADSKPKVENIQLDNIKRKESQLPSPYFFIQETFDKKSLRSTFSRPPAVSSKAVITNKEVEAKSEVNGRSSPSPRFITQNNINKDNFSVDVASIKNHINLTPDPKSKPSIEGDLAKTENTSVSLSNPTYLQKTLDYPSPKLIKLESHQIRSCSHLSPAEMSEDLQTVPDERKKFKLRPDIYDLSTGYNESLRQSRKKLRRQSKIIHLTSDEKRNKEVNAISSQYIKDYKVSNSDSTDSVISDSPMYKNNKIATNDFQKSNFSVWSTVRYHSDAMISNEQCSSIKSLTAINNDQEEDKLSNLKLELDTKVDSDIVYDKYNKDERVIESFEVKTSKILSTTLACCNSVNGKSHDLDFTDILHNDKQELANTDVSIKHPLEISDNLQGSVNLFPNKNSKENVINLETSIKRFTLLRDDEKTKRLQPCSNSKSINENDQCCGIAKNVNFGNDVSSKVNDKNVQTSFSKLFFGVRDKKIIKGKTLYKDLSHAYTDDFKTFAIKSNSLHKSVINAQGQSFSQHFKANSDAINNSLNSVVEIPKNKFATIYVKDKRLPGQEEIEGKNSTLDRIWSIDSKESGNSLELGQLNKLDESNVLLIKNKNAEFANKKLYVPQVDEIKSNVLIHRKGLQSTNIHLECDELSNIKKINQEYKTISDTKSCLNPISSDGKSNDLSSYEKYNSGEKDERLGQKRTGLIENKTRSPHSNEHSDERCENNNSKNYFGAPENNSDTFINNYQSHDDKEIKISNYQNNNRTDLRVVEQIEKKSADLESEKQVRLQELKSASMLSFRSNDTSVGPVQENLRTRNELTNDSTTLPFNNHSDNVHNRTDVSPLLLLLKERPWLKKESMVDTNQKLSTPINKEQLLNCRELNYVSNGSIHEGSDTEDIISIPARNDTKSNFEINKTLKFGNSGSVTKPISSPLAHGDGLSNNNLNTNGDLGYQRSQVMQKYSDSQSLHNDNLNEIRKVTKEEFEKMFEKRPTTENAVEREELKINKRQSVYFNPRENTAELQKYSKSIKLGISEYQNLRNTYYHLQKAKSAMESFFDGTDVNIEMITHYNETLHKDSNMVVNNNDSINPQTPQPSFENTNAEYYTQGSKYEPTESPSFAYEMENPLKKENYHQGCMNVVGKSTFNKELVSDIEKNSYQHDLMIAAIGAIESIPPGTFVESRKDSEQSYKHFVEKPRLKKELVNDGKKNNFNTDYSSLAIGAIDSIPLGTFMVSSNAGLKVEVSNENVKGSETTVENPSLNNYVNENNNLNTATSAINSAPLATSMVSFNDFNLQPEQVISNDNYQKLLKTPNSLHNQNTTKSTNVVFKIYSKLFNKSNRIPSNKITLANHEVGTTVDSLNYKNYNSAPSSVENVLVNKSIEGKDLQNNDIKSEYTGQQYNVPAIKRNETTATGKISTADSSQDLNVSHVSYRHNYHENGPLGQTSSYKSSVEPKAETNLEKKSFLNKKIASAEDSFISLNRFFNMSEITGRVDSLSPFTWFESQKPKPNSDSIRGARTKFGLDEKALVSTSSNRAKMIYTNKNVPNTKVSISYNSDKGNLHYSDQSKLPGPTGATTFSRDRLLDNLNETSNVRTFNKGQEHNIQNIVEQIKGRKASTNNSFSYITEESKLPPNTLYNYLYSHNHKLTADANLKSDKLPEFRNLKSTGLSNLAPIKKQEDSISKPNHIENVTHEYVFPKPLDSSYKMKPAPRDSTSNENSSYSKRFQTSLKENNSTSQPSSRHSHNNYLKNSKTALQLESCKNCIMNANIMSSIYKNYKKRNYILDLPKNLTDYLQKIVSWKSYSNFLSRYDAIECSNIYKSEIVAKPKSYMYDVSYTTKKFSDPIIKSIIEKVDVPVNMLPNKCAKFISKAALSMNSNSSSDLSLPEIFSKACSSCEKTKSVLSNLKYGFTFSKNNEPTLSFRDETISLNSKENENKLSKEFQAMSCNKGNDINSSEISSKKNVILKRNISRKKPEVSLKQSTSSLSDGNISKSNVVMSKTMSRKVANKPLEINKKLPCSTCANVGSLINPAKLNQEFFNERSYSKKVSSRKSEAQSKTCFIKRKKNPFKTLSDIRSYHA